MAHAACPRIFIVGFMGTGKSEVARLAARKLAVAWADTDELIERQEGRSIAAIFAGEGEAYFRRREREVLGTVCRHAAYGVVACGGGIVLDPENIRLMKQAGRIICLSARPEVIVARVRHQTHRPLLQGPDPEQRIRDLLAERAQFYAQADADVDVSELTPRQAAVEVVRAARSVKE